MSGSDFSLKNVPYIELNSLLKRYSAKLLY